MVQYQQAHLDATFAALSDATRRGVLEQLGHADASITDLAEKFHMTLTGMKKHVGVLEQAGLVTTEKVGRVRWTGAAVGFLGMLVLVRPDSHLDKIGVLFALLTVVCNVSFQLLTRRLAQVENSFTTMFISAAISVVISAALLPLQSRWGGWPAALSGQQLLMLATLGVLGAVSQWCLIRAYVWSSASFIAPLLFMQLIWSTATGYLFFQQLPDRYSLLGILVILGSGVATMVFAARSESQH